MTKLAKFSRSPDRKHFKALVHLLQYVKSNPNKGLRFYSDIEKSPLYEMLSENGIEMFHRFIGLHDSSWQDCPDTGRSTGCYMNFVQGGLVDFSSFTPTPVAMSSAEAEINAGASACMSMSHLRMVHNELGGKDPDLLWDPPILLLCDNNSAVILSNLEKDTKNLRHSKRRLMFMRQVRREGEMQFKFLSNKFMCADVGTKNLDVPSFQPQVSLFLVDVQD